MTGVLIATAGFLAAFGLGFIAWGVRIFRGNGWETISMPDKAKAKWDKRALCRFVGGFMGFMGFCIILMGIGILTSCPEESVWGVGALMTAGSVFILVKMFFPNEKQKKQGIKD